MVFQNAQTCMLHYVFGSVRTP